MYIKECEARASPPHTVGPSLIFNTSHISKDLLLKLPVLETFIVSHCSFINTHTMILDSPLLKIFEILNCRSMNNPDGSRVCKIRVLGSKLEKVTFFGENPEQFFLDFPPSLPYAHLSLSTRKSAVKFIESFTCVKSLNFEITEPICQFLNAFEMNKVSKFRKLIYLDLRYNMTYHSNFTMLLKAAPILEKLRLRHLDSTRFFSTKILRILFSETVPECIQITLKIFQIRDFQTNKIQLALLKYVMENAKKLESITLFTSKTIVEEDKAQVLSYPKASPHASIVFETSI